MELNYKKTIFIFFILFSAHFILQILLSSSMITITAVKSMILDIEVIIGFFHILVYSIGLGISVKYFWEKNAKFGIYLTSLIGIYILLTGRISEIGIPISSEATVIGFSASLLGFLLFSSTLEYLIKNQAKFKSLIKVKSFQYSFAAGWTHLTASFIFYIMAYSPEYVISNLLNLELISGVAGSFLLGFIPVYTHLDYEDVTPLILVSIWVLWGVFGFFTSFSSYPVSQFFPPPEFMIPPAPGYIFSNLIPVSVILLYLVKTTRTELRKKK